MKLVVDASVAVKWFTTEQWTEESRRLLTVGIDRHAPNLILAETTNVLWKKARRGEIEAPHDYFREAANVVNAFEDSGFLLKDMLAWKKKSAYHRAQRVSVVFQRRGLATEAEQRFIGFEAVEAFHQAARQRLLDEAARPSGAPSQGSLM